MSAQAVVQSTALNVEAQEAQVESLFHWLAKPSPMVVAEQTMHAITVQILVVTWETLRSPTEVWKSER